MATGDWEEGHESGVSRIRYGEEVGIFRLVLFTGGEVSREIVEGNPSYRGIAGYGDPSAGCKAIQIQGPFGSRASSKDPA